MYKNILIPVIVLLLISGCEEDPDICIEQSSFPVIFSAFNKQDSVNVVRLSKSFSGDNGGSLYTAKIWDSIYFKDADIKALFFYEVDTGIGIDTVNLVKEYRENQEPGIFLSPNYPAYVLYKDLAPYYLSYALKIEIPGYNIPIGECRLLDTVDIFFPRYRKTLELNQEQILFVRWNSRYSDLNDFMLSFVIDSYINGSTHTDTLTYSKRNIKSSGHTPPFIQAEFKYPQFLSLLNRQFSSNNVDYRSIKSVFFKCTSSVGLYSYLTKDDENPFGKIASDYKMFNPLTTWFGFIASRTETTRSNFKIDSYSIAKMNEDTAFSKFKIVKW